MSERTEVSNNDESLPKAQVKKIRSPWLWWLVPLAAALFCGWLIYRDLISKGPTITISFKNADDMEADNTPVKYRGVEIGKVKKISLASNQQMVDVEVSLLKDARDIARAGSLFWIVQPEVSVGAVKGLRTIVSGDYITVRPGTGARTNRFLAPEQAPVVTQPVKALQITLLAPNLSSLQEQSPVFYRGIQVGEVLNYQLGNDAQEVRISAQIKQDYARLVRLNSKFWNAGGVHMDFSIFGGAKISAESAKTLLSGGIEFGTPDNFQGPASDGTTYRLYEKPLDEWKTWTPAIPLNLPANAHETKTPRPAVLK